MKVTGACHCGFITIEGEADPERVTVCHCTDCQNGTGSAFRNSVPVSGSTFKMTGEPTGYVNLAYVYHQAGQIDDELRTLDAFVQRQPDWKNGHAFAMRGM